MYRLMARVRGAVGGEISAHLPLPDSTVKSILLQVQPLHHPLPLKFEDSSSCGAGQLLSPHLFRLNEEDGPAEAIVAAGSGPEWYLGKSGFIVFMVGYIDFGVREIPQYSFLQTYSPTVTVTCGDVTFAVDAESSFQTFADNHLVATFCGFRHVVEDSSGLRFSNEIGFRDWTFLDELLTRIAQLRAMSRWRKATPRPAVNDFRL